MSVIKNGRQCVNSYVYFQLLGIVSICFNVPQPALTQKKKSCIYFSFPSNNVVTALRQVLFSVRCTAVNSLYRLLLAHGTRHTATTIIHNKNGADELSANSCQWTPNFRLVKYDQLPQCKIWACKFQTKLNNPDIKGAAREREAPIH